MEEKDSVDFGISIKQAGGARDYRVCDIAIPIENERPLDVANAMNVCHQALPKMRDQLIRASGLVYMLQFIQEGSEGCEMGVDLGDGLARTLTRKPRHIDAVDHWKAWETMGFGDKRQEVMDQRYEFVKNRFKEHRAVHLWRMSTEEFIAERIEGAYDWVFVDANHRYPACRDDMLGAFKLLKPGGYMFIDDAYVPEWQEQVQRGIAGLLKEHGGNLEKVWTESDPVIYRKG